jgi:hypothetical protein
VRQIREDTTTALGDHVFSGRPERPDAFYDWRPEWEGDTIGYPPSFESERRRSGGRENGPTPRPRRSPRCLAQRGRPQRRGSPGDLREQGGHAPLMVGGEEEGQPISVDAPYDRSDIER